MMRLILRTNSTALATNDIVLPVSDEVNCQVCHASGSLAAAQPTNGWVWNANPEHDYRLNILRRHDELKNWTTYPGILASNGYNPAGLYRTVVADGKPVLCVRCHKSTAQPGSGFGTIKPLTQAIHTHHASVIDPSTGATLDSSTDRSACYHCHPGPMTHALRGVMGEAGGTNGLHSIQCQNCHGNLSLVGSTNRVGWVDLPDCQSCHVGNAVNAGNNPLRYTSAFTNYATGGVRQQVDATFATTTNLAFGNYSLFRYSTNHGKLFCSACHNSAHAEFPAARNDNVRVLEVQADLGMLSDCTACHNTIPGSGVGPHGAHEFGQNWAQGGNPDHIGNSGAACNACHGSNERGTILSQSKSDQILSTTSFGDKYLFRGAIIGCYLCHSGSGSLNPTKWSAATAADVATNTASGKSVLMRLPIADANSPTQITNKSFFVRIISQPVNGSVGITNLNATNWAAVYVPDAGFVGTNTFTYAAFNTYVDSALYNGTVVVTQGVYSISAQALVPASYPAAWPVPFGVVATPSNIIAKVSYDWDFGDGSSHNTNQYAVHTYGAPGNYTWKVISTVQATSPKSTTNSAAILIGGPVLLSAVSAPGFVTLSWPRTLADALLETAPQISGGSSWSVVTNAVVTSASGISVTVPNSSTPGYFRLRKL